MIFVAPHDVRAVLDLDVKSIEKAAQSNAILNADVLKHLVSVLIDDTNKNVSLKVQLIKTF